MKVGTVLDERRSSGEAIEGPVMREAEHRGWIRPFGRGQYVCTVEWTFLLRTLQEMLRKQATEQLGFEEWLFPRSIPREALVSCRLTQSLKEDRSRKPGGGGTHEHHVGGHRSERADDDIYLDSDEICGCSVEGEHLVDSFKIGIDNASFGAVAPVSGSIAWSSHFSISTASIQVAGLTNSRPHANGLRAAGECE